LDIVTNPESKWFRLPGGEFIMGKRAEFRMKRRA